VLPRDPKDSKLIGNAIETTGFWRITIQRSRSFCKHCVCF